MGIATLTRRRRLGWLLRANRTYRPDIEPRHLREFSAACGERGYRVSPSTLSRWENGRVDPTYEGVACYERVLELAPRSLVAVCDTVSRYLTPPGRSAPVLARSTIAVGRLDTLLDRALGGDRMTAVDWDDLTCAIAGRPDLRLAPTRAWDELAARLLTEMSIADGYYWMVRAEALNRLMAHPVGQSAAISVAATAAADRSIQSLIGTVTVFDASADHAASAHVIRHLTSPVTDRTFYGGLLASAKKLRFGHFGASQVAGLLPVLLDVVTAARGSANEALLAAILVDTLPPNRTRRLGVSARRVIAGLLARLEMADPAVHRIRAEVAAEVAAPDGGVIDPVFPVLVRELLHDPVFDVRLYTCFLIDATPLRVPLASALGRELTRSVRCGAVDRSVILLEALRVLGSGEQRRQIERLLATPGLPHPVANSAAYALGHIRGTTITGSGFV